MSEAAVETEEVVGVPVTSLGVADAGVAAAVPGVSAITGSPRVSVKDLRLAPKKGIGDLLKPLKNPKLVKRLFALSKFSVQEVAGRLETSVKRVSQLVAGETEVFGASPERQVKLQEYRRLWIEALTEVLDLPTEVYANLFDEHGANPADVADAVGVHWLVFQAVMKGKVPEVPGKIVAAINQGFEASCLKVPEDVRRGYIERARVPGRQGKDGEDLRPMLQMMRDGFGARGETERKDTRLQVTATTNITAAVISASELENRMRRAFGMKARGALPEGGSVLELKEGEFESEPATLPDFVGELSESE